MTKTPPTARQTSILRSPWARSAPAGPPPANGFAPGGLQRRRRQHLPGLGRPPGPRRKAVAVTSVDPTTPAAEAAAAAELAGWIGVRHEALDLAGLPGPDFCANTPERCYHCKKDLLPRLKERATELGLAWVAAGENIDDNGDYRPGRRAARELGVRHPLVEAGLGKAEIRLLSRRPACPPPRNPPWRAWPRASPTARPSRPSCWAGSTAARTSSAAWAWCSSASATTASSAGSRSTRRDAAPGRPGRPGAGGGVPQGARITYVTLDLQGSGPAP